MSILRCTAEEYVSKSPKARIVSCWILALCFITNHQGAIASTLSLEWERHYGTGLSDEVFSANIDSSGNVLLAGQTHGSFHNPDAVSTGTVDAFVAKYDAHGQALWARTLGEGANDAAWGVAAGENGNVYISGISQTGIGGPPGYGAYSFLACYDSTGALQWVKQVDADGAPGPAYAAIVVVGPSDSVFVASADYVAKYDHLGNHQWIRTPTNSTEWKTIYEIASDSRGHLYVVGFTQSSTRPVPDGFLTKYDGSGNELWHRQFGTDEDEFVDGIAIDDQGNIYVSGGTSGSLAAENAGGQDIFVGRWSSDGELDWIRQFGTPLDERAGVSIASDGVFFSGRTEAESSPYGPPWDLVAGELTSDGELIWMEDFASMGYYTRVVESAEGLASIYVAGTDYSNNTISGSIFDPGIYLAKVNVVPEPSSFTLTILIASTLTAAGSRLRRMVPNLRL